MNQLNRQRCGPVAKIVYRFIARKPNNLEAITCHLRGIDKITTDHAWWYSVASDCVQKLVALEVVRQSEIGVYEVLKPLTMDQK